MASIRSKNTRPEIIVRKYLFGRGFRFRVNHKRLPGKPDIVLRKYRTVIFVNGCFWHGHDGCKFYVLPKTNVEFWKSKIERNKVRDLAVRVKLANMGWRVLTIWECQLRSAKRQHTLCSLEYTLNHVYLSDMSIKHYCTSNREETMVAEGECGYDI